MNRYPAHAQERAFTTRFSWLPRMLFVFIVSPFAFASGSSNEVSGSNACSATTAAAFKACEHDVQNDYWIAIGNCNNLSSTSARERCIDDAGTTQNDDKEECGAQREARQSICRAIGNAAYDPKLDPADFVDPAQIGRSVTSNPYFPLVRGRTWVYRSGTETVTVTVTDETKEIQGITAAIIRDVVRDNGTLVEDTLDWYAQDMQGNVWYLGEISQEFENGELTSLEGSWKAGSDSSKPGIIMKARPAVGDIYRQEFSLGNAEDMAEVISVTGSSLVPGGSCNGRCLITREFTPLEPDVVENKYYAPGIGPILEVNPETGERLELIEMRN